MGNWSWVSSASRAASLAALSVCSIHAADTHASPATPTFKQYCFQCHGTNGKGPGFDTIAGKSASEIYQELKDFQAGKEGAGIMAKHSMGYTDAQLQSLAAWLATQR